MCQNASVALITSMLVVQGLLFMLMLLDILYFSHNTLAVQQ